MLLLALAALLAAGTAFAAPAASDLPWEFRFFGVSVGADRNILQCAGDGVQSDVSLSSATFKADGSVNKKGGKFVADSPADGGSYYFTKIDPTTTNFRIEADVFIDRINPTPDGQEGFALMIRDSLGEQGVSGNWMSNLISVAGTKLPSPETAATIGIRAYTGIRTPEASEENDIKATRLGWYRDADGNLLKMEAGKTYRVSLEKTDYAYIASQYDPDTGAKIGSYTYYIPAKDPNATSVKSYKELDDPVTYIEPGAAYLALVTARGINATFKNIKFETSDWSAAGWKPQPTVYKDLAVEILSSVTAPKGVYNVIFRSNADGVANIYNGKDLVAADIDVEAGVLASAPVSLKAKQNTLSVEFQPDPEFRFSVYELLSSYEKASFTIDVSTKSIGSKNAIYVSPEGSANKNGKSAKKAVDILTALAYAAPGQKIILESGRYDLSDETLLISRGRNGSEKAPISVTTEDGFAILDFGGTGGGIKSWGNFWNFSNLCVTGTKSGSHGMQLAGSNCKVERVNFYNNGNSGLTVSGDSKDPLRFWPANNLVKNCTAINNADKAMEDADGFCAKLTTGPGNVFDGCISAYNADDGWDLFAKVATGQIGAVTIRNSVAYKNGYIRVKEGSTAKKFTFADIDCDKNGNLSFRDSVEMKAGNGNGFKMGGSSLPGGHILVNSIAYENKAKGIDSNSCPDIKVYNSTSYNNGSFNTALYTGNKSLTTGFEATGVISYRSAEANAKFGHGAATPGFVNEGENIALQKQANSVAFGRNNYWWNKDLQRSENTAGDFVTDAWFQSLDTGVAPSRKEDGSIDMHGLLLLTDEARLSTTAGARGSVWGQNEATIWVVGDSTVSAFADKYFIPREGYGEEISSYFNARVYNLAHSGASSLDFRTMEEYKTLMDGSGAVPALGDATGDRFLIIGFGHNDEKTEEARFRDPNGDWKTDGSFANSLYTGYVKPALDRGVVPVICTPIVRLTNENTMESYNSASGHKTSSVMVGGVLYKGGDYAAAILKMVKDLKKAGRNIEYIDLTSITANLNALFGEDAKYLHSFTGAKRAAAGATGKDVTQTKDGPLVPAGLDQTHTSVYGAKMNAYLISILSEETAPTLHKYSTGRDMPTYAEFWPASVNPDYEVLDYNAPTPAEMEKAMLPAFTDGDGRLWHASVFGDVGGQAKITEKNFTSAIRENGKSDANITIGVSGNSGKIASGSDGMLFYYFPIRPGTSFTLTAHAKIERFTANNQVSFGLMARDDLYIDRYVPLTMGDYVAAGVRNQGNIVNYGRKSSALIGDAPQEKIVLEAGAEYDLRLSGTKDGFTLTFGGNTVSAGFDYPLTAVDDETVYVGFYVVRNCEVTFSDVHLVEN